MIEYIYFVKCPNCEDEHFNAFDDAKAFACGCLSNKPIITQVEVNRNDFGECTDSHDLGTVWSWEDMMRDIPVETTFSKADTLADGDVDYFNEFDDMIVDSVGPAEPAEVLDRKPVPADMTIDDLVEEMERNENDVECTWCEELFDKSECRYEVDLGWLCAGCEAAIKSRGETLTFRENFDYDVSDCVASSDMEIWGVEPAGADESTYRAVLLKRYENVSVQGLSERQAVTDDMHDLGGVFAFMFDKDGNPVLDSWNVNQLNKLGHCEILFDDSRYDAALEAQFNKNSRTVSEDCAASTETSEVTEVTTESNKPVSHLETLEEAAEYRDRLILCDSCMTPSLDEETGICINCGASVAKDAKDAALTESYSSLLADEQKSLLESFINEVTAECERARTAGQQNVHQVVMPWELRDQACKHCLIESLEKAGFPGGQTVNYDDELVFVPLNDKGQDYGKTMEGYFTNN